MTRANKLSMDDPDMGEWTYTYDALGNLLTQTDARDCVTTMNYDWSQEGVSAITRNTPVEYLDELAQDIAQGWRGNPLKVLEIDGKLVSLDNRRLTVAKLLDIDVPVTITKGFFVDDLLQLYRRDGIFNQVRIRGTDLIIDMFGRLIGLSR